MFPGDRSSTWHRSIPTWPLCILQSSTPSTQCGETSAWNKILMSACSVARRGGRVVWPPAASLIILSLTKWRHINFYSNQPNSGKVNQSSRGQLWVCSSCCAVWLGWVDAGGQQSTERWKERTTRGVLCCVLCVVFCVLCSVMAMFHAAGSVVWAMPPPGHILGNLSK